MEKTMNKVTSLTLAAAFLGAVTTASMTLPAQAADGVKCYGIVKAGENDCANAAGTHSCAGHAAADYDGGDWKAVASADECTAMMGKTEPFTGMNPAKKSG
jgi:uncharacterized membrane protein